jgi:hypothetical protein
VSLSIYIYMYIPLQFLRAESCHVYIVTDLLKAFLGNGSTNTVNVQQWKMCLSGRMLLHVARQQRVIEDAG